MMKYIYDNKLNTKNAVVPLNIDELYNTKTIIKGKEFTERDKNIIIEYLKMNGIEVTSKAYSIAKFKYIAGEITKKLISDKKIKVLVK